MGNFKEAFRHRHAILPVIHVESQRQVIRNAEIARDEGADGVFLINMKPMKPKDLMGIQKVIRVEFPNWFIGVNFLGHPAVTVFENVNKGVSGVWIDDAKIEEYAERQIEATLINSAREKSNWKGLYFGGVAFKGQREVEDLALAAKIASNFMDVVTTSGERTGEPPHPGKIMIMKSAIGEKPLAIASGISSENVGDFKDNADAFLVATSLHDKGTKNFDKFRIIDLVKAVRGI